MGYLGVMTAMAKKNGKEVEPEIRTRLVCIGPEDLDKEEFKDLHSPDLSQWLDE
jgi:ABC-type sugar transport system substrate-binding protein